jgi:hypothetical protein
LNDVGLVTGVSGQPGARVVFYTIYWKKNSETTQFNISSHLWPCDNEANTDSDDEIDAGRESSSDGHDSENEANGGVMDREQEEDNEGVDGDDENDENEPDGEDIEMQ